MFFTKTKYKILRHVGKSYLQDGCALCEVETITGFWFWKKTKKEMKKLVSLDGDTYEYKPKNAINAYVKERACLWREIDGSLLSKKQSMAVNQAIDYYEKNTKAKKSFNKAIPVVSFE